MRKIKIKEPIPPKALQVAMVVAENFNVTVDQILGKTRYKEVVEARHTTIHLLHNGIYKRRVVLCRLGSWFKRDHTTVLHALANVNGWLDVYPDYAEKYAKLKKLTQGMAESKIEKMTIDERVMRLPDSDKQAIIKFIERMEKINELA